jgi:hypothetical protein
MKAQPGHAVHIGGQQDAVPVDRRVFVAETVRDAQRHDVAFAPPQRRGRQRAVHGQRGARRPGDVHGQLADPQIEVRPAQLAAVLARA